ncbi:MAG: TrkA family potassium uptake protein, partial [Candidatus Nanohaloarchaea archaeon]
MYVVIAGINALSKKLVEQLENKHDLVVVEEGKDKCERLYSSSGATVINRSPSALPALEDAGIEKADALISTLEDDNENMVVCSLAKKFGVKKVISKVENDEYLEAFHIIGAEAIAHTDLLLSEFLSTLEHPYLVKIANLSHNREILKAKIGESSEIKGNTAEEIQDDESFPNRFKIVAVVQESQILGGELSVELGDGDELILIGP